MCPTTLAFDSRSVRAPRGEGRLRAALWLVVAAALVLPASAAWTLSGRSGFDDNVFLQELGPLANRSSAVVTASADWRTQRKTDGPASWSAGYTAEGTVFLAEADESFHQHRLGWNLRRPMAAGLLHTTGSVVLTDGPDDPVIWPTTDGAPAGGAPSVRDRRDAIVWRAQAAVPFEVGPWVIRPAACLYQHDFRSRHLDVPGCANAVDRSDGNAGLDLGRRLLRGQHVFVGARWGRQDQEQLFAYPEEYDNTYTRVLALWERSTGPFRGTVALGPEWRRFGPRVPPAFGSRQRTNLFAEATLAWMPSRRDEWCGTLKQFEQPGASGRSSCRDLALELSWSRVLSPRTTTKLGLRAQRFDFRAPIRRDDWIYTLGASLRRTLSPQFTLTAEAQLQRGESLVPAPGRDYERDFVGVGLEYRAR